MRRRAGSVQLVVRGEVVALPLKGVIDLAAERARLAKEMQKADADIARSDAKLNNPKFVERAAEEVVDEEKEKRERGGRAQSEDRRGAGAAQERNVTLTGPGAGAVSIGKIRGDGMRGVISGIVPDGTYGQIAADDGQRYSYWSTEVRNGQARVGQTVEFQMWEGQPVDIFVVNNRAAAECCTAATCRCAAAEVLSLPPRLPAATPCRQAMPRPWTGSAGARSGRDYWIKLFTSPSGRISRKQFWLHGVLPIVVASIVLGWIPIIGQILSLAFLWGSICIAFKRFHDLGYPGWYSLVYLIPMLAAAIVLGVGFAVTTFLSLAWLLAEILWGIGALIALAQLIFVYIRVGQEGPNELRARSAGDLIGVSRFALAPEIDGSAKRLAQKPRALQPEAPRVLDRLGDADARADGDLRRVLARAQLERRPVERQAVVAVGDAERLAQFARPRAQRPLVRQAAPSPHGSNSLRRLERPDQHGAGAAFFLADEIEAPVDAVGAVDVGVAGRPEHHRIALGRTVIGMRRRIGVVIGLDLDDQPADAVNQ